MLKRELKIVNIIPCPPCDEFIKSKFYNELLDLPSKEDNLIVTEIILYWEIEEDKRKMDDLKRLGIFYYPCLAMKIKDIHYLHTIRFKRVLDFNRGNKYLIDTDFILHFLEHPRRYSTKERIYGNLIHQLHDTSIELRTQISRRIKDMGY